MKKVLLVILSILIIGTAWGIMLIEDVQKHIITPDYVEEVLAEVPAGEFAQQMLAGQMFADLPQGTPPILKQELPVAFIEVFDVPWFNQVLVTASDDIIDVITGKKAAITTVIDITSEKQELYDVLMNNLRDKSDEELMQGGLPRMMIDLMPPAQILGAIPNELPLDELIAQAGVPLDFAQLQQDYTGALSNYRTARMILIPVLLILVLLLAKIVGAFKWIGWSLIIAGGLYLIGLVIVRGMSSSIAADMQLPPGFTAGQVETVLRLTMDKFMVSPMITVGIGVVLAVIAIFLPKKIIQK